MKRRITYADGVPRWFQLLVHSWRHRQCSRTGHDLRPFRYIEGGGRLSEFHQFCNHCGQILDEETP